MKLGFELLYSLYNTLFNNKYIRADLSKNVKFIYYLKNIAIYLVPFSYYQKKLDKKILDLSKKYDENYILDRVNYYNKLQKETKISKDSPTIKEFQKIKKTTYFFDLNRYLKYFDTNKKISYMFGDVTIVPKQPSIVKSRPISEDNQNSILMKLNQVRHFIFVNDNIDYEDKKDLLVWRGKAHQEHRKEFLRKFYDHPLCDVGQIVKKKDKGEIPWKKGKMSIKQMLRYKFILAIEGNDVASNLKWIMSSNSLAFMVKPKFETWFMEGRLIPNYHYVLLKDDYSDLEEKIEYYSTHIDEAKQIVENANNYIEQFKDKEREDLISLLVLQKYFDKVSL